MKTYVGVKQAKVGHRGSQEKWGFGLTSLEILRNVIVTKVTGIFFLPSDCGSGTREIENLQTLPGRFFWEQSPGKLQTVCSRH